jgi:uncharacterized protein
MEESQELPQLSQPEIRVLGVLMEKSKTTPDYYPMTLNSLTAACNQKSARHPVVDYDEQTVVVALNGLKGRSLVATAVGGGSRTIKYKHNFGTVFPIEDAGLAILCLLFLRGPLTAGEINSNSGRLYEFRSLEEVQRHLITLASEKPPFVAEIARRPGQKETRFAHLFSPLPEPGESSSAEPARVHVSELEERLTKVETELAEVKATLAKLLTELS